jgi:pyridoxamine 5'-phosphate oxidase
LKKKDSNLSETGVRKDPFTQFMEWFGEAEGVVTGDLNAMCLATATLQGRPSSRIVLLREVDFRGFVFYTNYDSRKGKEISANPYVSAVIHWKELERQIRITGKVKKVSRQESESYFESRPLQSRISAAVSPQSRVIPGRKFLESAREQFIAELKDPGHVPCPENWGGYRIVPDEIEFWQGREFRFHDRIVYRRKGKQWIIRRLAP